MSNSEPDALLGIVDVRVIEPIPPRGRTDITQTMFGQVKIGRTSAATSPPGPVMLLPDRPTRIKARIRNASELGGPPANSTLDIVYLGSSPSVAAFTGCPVPDMTETEVIGPGAVYGILDPNVGAATDVVIVGTIDEFAVNIVESRERRRRRNS